MIMQTLIIFNQITHLSFDIQQINNRKYLGEILLLIYYCEIVVFEEYSAQCMYKEQFVYIIVYISRTVFSLTALGWNRQLVLKTL